MVTSQNVIRVLVIDDSAYNRKSIKTMLESDPGIKVVGTAINGEDGIKKLLALKPDVVTLDLQMPGIDGFTFLRIVMSQYPIPVIVVSSKAGDHNVFKAMELGAADFLAKPTNKVSIELSNIQEDLRMKVRSANMINLTNIRKRLESLSSKIEKGEIPPVPRVKEKKFVLEAKSKVYAAIAIGASTGGPSALQKILAKIETQFLHPILVSQHMPPGFTRAFAERLNRYSYLYVKEAENGEALVSGWVYIAPGGYNMMVEKIKDEVTILLKPRASSDKYIPSVDILFSSVAAIFGESSLGIILTGMGNDGKNGLQRIKEEGGRTIAESEESSVVFGMPKEAIQSGYVEKILPIDLIPDEICEWAIGVTKEKIKTES